MRLRPVGDALDACPPLGPYASSPHHLDQVLLAPMAVGSALTGIVLATATPFGFFHHWWGDREVRAHPRPALSRDLRHLGRARRRPRRAGEVAGGRAAFNAAGLSGAVAIVRRVDGYRRRDVSDWDVVNPEPVGREEKVWIRPPRARTTTGSHENDWLFKPVVTTSSGHRQGEDWSEKLAYELGRSIGVPCAEVELAISGGVEGSISRNVVPDGWNRVHGAILLGSRLAGYVPGQQNPPGRWGHSVRNIMDVLRDVEAPPDCGVADAVSTFAGYLVLDAWVGNQDRHDQNWAIVRQSTTPGAVRIAPSYDHASGLAFQRLDSFRVARPRSGTVGDFAANARAQRFQHDPYARRSDVRTSVQVAGDGLEIAGPEARRCWIERLAAVGEEQLEAIVASVPGLSKVTRTFTLDLVRINRERLLRECR